jgi:hypothetical protein
MMSELLAVRALEVDVLDEHCGRGRRAERRAVLRNPAQERVDVGCTREGVGEGTVRRQRPDGAALAAAEDDGEHHGDHDRNRCGAGDHENARRGLPPHRRPLRTRRGSSGRGGPAPLLALLAARHSRSA